MTDTKGGQMGIWMTSSLVVGTIIGAAVFMMPVALAPLGRNALFGWVVSGAGVLCIAFALAQVSRLGGEGIQANIEKMFGPTIGFLVAWGLWISNWVANASIAIAAASTLSFIGPAFGGPDTVVPVAIGWVILLTAINALGIRAAGGVSVATVAIKILPLLAVIWVFLQRSASGVAYQQLPPAPISFANVAAATALTFFAFTGFENATTPVGKVRDPSRTIPRALLAGTIFVVLLYLAASTSIQMLLPAGEIVASSAPFADALVSQWGHGIASFAAIAIVISAIGCLNCLILGTGELGYSMALRGDLPAVMARTRGANTPVVSQLVGSGLTILLLLANNSRATADLYKFIVLLSTAAIIPIYLFGALAAWKLSPTMRTRSIVVVALIFVAFATYGIGLEANLWGLLLLAAGLAIRAAMRRLNSRAPSPVLAAAPAAPRE